ncbi:hypothetical protein [Mycobacterium sp. shizuoka-1]|uniref:hypothetical protein n=1 Tax=Mycobacterium sp. shizuoka-1 TaxID=2039281 RepID=UPI000C05EE72|nr:hypothetical protein [Mycobacterium sp. shizuoka-1]GAY15018.1 hypothetical protein MSZK_17440 [Mycobacterium sp. shizuoka-1]
MDATAGPDATVRRWVSTLLGGLGILALGVLVAAVVSVSHESSHPAGHAHPVATSGSALATASHTTTIASPSAAPAGSWAVTAIGATHTATPLATAPKHEPSVRQRLHDMFPRLFPGH